MPLKKIATLRRTRTASADVRKAQIIEAGKACFVRRGFAVTRMADIAELADVSVGLVYRYFPSKDALVEAIVAQQTRDQAELLMSSLDRGHADVAPLAQLLESLRPLLLDRDRVALMVEIAAELMRNERARALAKNIQLRALEKASERIAPRLAPGTSNDDVSINLQLLSALVSGVAIQLSVIPELRRKALFDRLEEVAEAILVVSIRNRPQT